MGLSDTDLLDPGLCGKGSQAVEAEAGDQNGDQRKNGEQADKLFVGLVLAVEGGIEKEVIERAVG